MIMDAGVVWLGVSRVPQLARLGRLRSLMMDADTATTEGVLIP